METTEQETPVIEQKMLKRNWIIDAARKAPSGDNCQPWSYKWKGDKLYVYHNNVRAQHYLNSNNYASLVSLGCVVESISLAARRQQYAIKYNYYDISASDSPCLSVEFSNDYVSDEFEATLLSNIPKRYTYRESCLNTGLKTSLLNVKQQLINNNASADFQVIENSPDELTRFLVESDSFVWSKVNGAKDIFKSIRFSSKAYTDQKDGMYWRHLGMNVMEKNLMKSIRFNPNLLKYLNPLGFKMTLQKKIEQNIKTSSGFICFTVAESTHQSIINAARIAMRCWLKLVDEGFVVQPNMASLYSFYACQGILPSDLTKEEKKYFESGNTILQKHFNTKHQPIWLFRYGVPFTHRKEESIRKSIDELVIS